MVTRKPSFRVFALVLLASCRDSTAPVGGGNPVISLTIIGGDSIHAGSITLSSRPDSALPDTALPADPARIALEIVDSAGNRFPLMAGAGRGQFVSAFPAAAGARYTLVGTAYGRAVSASTRTPSSFSIVMPAADTITLADGRTTLATLIVPYQFTAIDAAGFGAFVSLPGGSVQLAVSLAAPAGEMVILRDPNVRSLTLLAYDRGATGCHVSRRPVGNVQGALGCFGSALRLRRAVNAP